MAEAKKRTYKYKSKATRQAKSKLGHSTIQNNKRTTAVLLTRHNINGVFYGPGEVTGPNGLIQALLHADQLVVQSERDFLGTKAVVIGPNRSTRQVPFEMLNSDQLAVPEAEFIGKGDWNR